MFPDGALHGALKKQKEICSQCRDLAKRNAATERAATPPPHTLLLHQCVWRPSLLVSKLLTKIDTELKKKVRCATVKSLRLRRRRNPRRMVHKKTPGRSLKCLYAPIRRIQITEFRFPPLIPKSCRCESSCSRILPFLPSPPSQEII